MDHKAPAAFVCTPVMNYHQGVLYPAMQDARRDNPHLGVYLLISRLHKNSCDCDLVDWVSELPDIQLDDLVIRLARYRVVFFSCNSMNWATVRLISIGLRKLSPSIKLCIGGPHPTMYPGMVEDSKLFDAYFRGEADNTIHLIYQLLLDKTASEPAIAGLWMPSHDLHDRPVIVQNYQLDQLDWEIKYDLIPSEKYLSIPVETSRGCKFTCAFCSIPSQRNWRGFSSELAIKKLLHAHDHINKALYRKISIIDDAFTTDHHRTQEICDLLCPDKFRTRLMYDSTLVDLQNRDLISSLEPFTSDLLVGAEVATIKDAKKIKKPTNPKLIMQAAANLEQCNLAHRAVFSFIIGFPWQSVDDCINTVKLVTNLILDYGVRVYLQWYWPMPGSAIWDMLESEGKVEISIANTPGFYSSEQWFYKVRNIDRQGVEKIDSRIRPIQLCLTLSSGNFEIGHHPLEYSPPELASENGSWESQRNPFDQPVDVE